MSHHSEHCTHGDDCRHVTGAASNLPTAEDAPHPRAHVAREWRETNGPTRWRLWSDGRMEIRYAPEMSWGESLLFVSDLEANRCITEVAPTETPTADGQEGTP